MSEVVNVVVAIAVIVFVIRWATSGESPEDQRVRTTLGFRPKNVTPEMPPAGYFRIYPRTDSQGQRPPSQQPTRPASAASSANAQPQPQASSSSSSFVKPGPSLIERYQLKERLSGQGGVAIDSPEQAGGKASWEATPERREASLKERKAQMVLAARKRLLEQQKAVAEAAGTGSSSPDVKTD
ncbi:hypothetical protein A7U60_g2070 [Sanghuangporus baumii]|uniref:CUE domain-containing protein n=1 Tax=Sanghuangporus baumii TaxID=108892 RepID=A0A9Q5NAV1_SANBA|nr:hypothetical protein A7U60_g2070 [Sanghuangporus baumii]